ncbi:MAG: hypothetical protein Q9M75_08455 [Ghiorsea sp.]|nr:hypothetical protein [Ghiorsea sp.]
MNYEEMIRNKAAFESLTRKDIEKMKQLNQKLQSYEKSLVKSAKRADEELSARVQDSNDMLLDYNIVCEIRFPFAADTNKEPLRRRSFFSCSTLSDWTEEMKGVSVKGSNMDNGENYNSLCHVSDDDPEYHCWLLHILYAKFQLPWDDIFNIEAVWTDLEITHYYCMNLSNTKEVL